MTRLAWGRKFFSFIITVVILEFSAFLFLLLGFHVIGDKDLTYKYFEIISHDVFMLSLGFFCANTVEHITGVFKK